MRIEAHLTVSSAHFGIMFVSQLCAYAGVLLTDAELIFQPILMIHALRSSFRASYKFLCVKDHKIPCGTSLQLGLRARSCAASVEADY
jgi:hypothetical protein